MQKIRAAVKTPLALLVLLAVCAHLAPIVLMASSIGIGIIQTFTSRDEFLAQLGSPQLAYNFNGLANGRTNLLALDGLTIAGDMQIDRGAINFSGASRAALNFGSDIFSFGADVAPIGGTGQVLFDLGGGQSALWNVTGPGFVGFRTNFGFRNFGATFINFASDVIILDQGAADVSGTSFLLDNVIANTADSVPEPTTLLLLATGAGLLAASRRRRTHADAVDPARHDGGPADPM
jgi:hypothetical protein